MEKSGERGGTRKERRLDVPEQSIKCEPRPIAVLKTACNIMALMGKPICSLEEKKLQLNIGSRKSTPGGDTICLEDCGRTTPGKRHVVYVVQKFFFQV